MSSPVPALSQITSSNTNAARDTMMSIIPKIMLPLVSKLLILIIIIKLKLKRMTLADHLDSLFSSFDLFFLSPSSASDMAIACLSISSSS